MSQQQKNEPTTKSTTEQKEFCADDYARYCGFEKELKENLRVEINNIDDSDKVSLTQRRIDRILDNVDPILNFNHKPNS